MLEISFRACYNRVIEKLNGVETMSAKKKAAGNAEPKDDLYFIKLTIDLAFKYVFGEPKNIELLKSLLKDITKLPIERLEGLGFMGEELHRDSLTDRKTGDDIMKQVYEQARTIAMNETKRIEIENRELFLIGQNTLEQYGREQGRLEAQKEFEIEIKSKDDEIQRLKEELDKYKMLQGGNS